jgi:hypothetical protein
VKACVGVLVKEGEGGSEIEKWNIPNEGKGWKDSFCINSVCVCVHFLIQFNTQIHLYTHTNTHLYSLYIYELQLLGRNNLQSSKSKAFNLLVFKLLGSTKNYI